jgi:hypothetical protein
VWASISLNRQYCLCLRSKGCSTVTYRRGVLVHILLYTLEIRSSNLHVISSCRLRFIAACPDFSWKLYRGITICYVTYKTSVTSASPLRIWSYTYICISRDKLIYKFIFQSSGLLHRVVFYASILEYLNIFKPEYCSLFSIYVCTCMYV